MAAYVIMGQSLLVFFSCNRLGKGIEKYFQAVDLCALVYIFFASRRLNSEASQPDTD